MTIPYNPNVPLATSSPSQDQPILLANSQVINEYLNADGVDVGSSENVGFSNQRTLVRKTAPVAADQVNGRIFSMEDSDGNAQLFWISPIQDGSTISQITPVNTSSGAGTSGLYSYTQVITGALWRFTQAFWIMPNGLQVKTINVSGQALSAISSLAIPYYGNSGVSAPFASSVYSAILSTLSNSVVSAGGTVTGLFPNINAPNAANRTNVIIVPKVSSTISYTYVITLMGI